MLARRMGLTAGNRSAPVLRYGNKQVQPRIPPVESDLQQPRGPGEGSVAVGLLWRLRDTWRRWLLRWPSLRCQSPHWPQTLGPVARAQRSPQTPRPLPNKFSPLLRVWSRTSTATTGQSRNTSASSMWFRARMARTRKLWPTAPNACSPPGQVPCGCKQRKAARRFLPSSSAASCNMRSARSIAIFILTTA